MSIDLSPEVISAVLEALPTARLEEASPLGEGWSVVAHRVPAEDGDWALRVLKPGSPWAPEHIEREARLLPGLEAAGLPVPRSTRLMQDARGRPLGVLQRVLAGSAATRVRVGRPNTARFAEDVARFLARLHGFPTERAAALGAQEVDLWQLRYARLIEAAAARLPPKSAAWVNEQAREFIARGGTSSAPRVLIHGDIQADHTLVDKNGRLTGVLDWADAYITDPALDFAGLLNEWSWAFLERVLAAYEALGGAVDPDARRRVRFYIAVAPVFGVVYAAESGFPERAAHGRRRIAARASAATRRAER